VASPIRDLFVLDLRIAPGDAKVLEAAAKTELARRTRFHEDTAEDMVARLRDPRFFGEFAASLLDRSGLQRSTRLALAEHAFDLLPLPRTEDEVILVESRAPPRLLKLADFLGASSAFTMLHVLHLVYAVFLDRFLVTRVARPVRASVLKYVLKAEASPELRGLYGGLHLASVPPREASDEFQRVLRARSISMEAKRVLASLAAADDGGLTVLAGLAEKEGLLPVEAEPAESPSVLANVPRLPPELAPTARGWLERRRRMELRSRARYS